MQDSNPDQPTNELLVDGPSVLLGHRRAPEESLSAAAHIGTYALPAISGRAAHIAGYALAGHKRLQRCVEHRRSPNLGDIAHSEEWTGTVLLLPQLADDLRRIR
jgi:hypothetical protein